DTGIIYVIGEVGLSTPVKIGLAGSAKHAHKRILTFSTGNFRPMEALAVLTTPHARWVEHQLHCALAPWRVKSKNATEWFDVRQLVTAGWEELFARSPGSSTGQGRCPRCPTVRSTGSITSTAGPGTFEPCACAAGSAPRARC